MGYCSPRSWPGSSWSCSGAARLGSVIRFIPHPVIVGFTAGIGVVIWVGQWKDFFGLHPAPHQHFHEQVWHLLQVLPQLNTATTVLAAGSLLLAIYGPKVPGLKRVPGPLIAMLAATAAHTLLRLNDVATIGSAFGGVPSGLPSLTFPEITFGRIVTLIPAAFTIAMLGAIESLLSAVVADGMAETRHDSNQELIGQGIANILAPLLRGFAATGAIARTATNFRNGANSPIAGVVHALTLVLVILVLSPVAARIPLVFAGGDPVRDRLEHERREAFRSPRATARRARMLPSCSSPSGSRCSQIWWSQ